MYRQAHKARVAQLVNGHGFRHCVIECEKHKSLIKRMQYILINTSLQPSKGK
jgi:hypothetical protein